MARKKTPTPAAASPGKLAGKKIAFVGAFDYRQPDALQAVAVLAGAAIVDPTANEPDLLVHGAGRGGKPPGDVARWQKRYPALQALDVPTFCRLLVPSREELLHLIATNALDAPSPRDSTGWEPLEQMLHWADATVDLTGADLRGANLSAARLYRITLDDADLTGAKVDYAHTDTLRRVNLDRSDAVNFYLPNAEDCTFREANLEKLWGFWGDAKLVERCDFTAAKLTRARFRQRGAVLRHCTLQRADLTGVELEYTTFEACDFRDADLTGVLASGTKFERVDFRGAKLRRADLSHGSLVGADLSNADLRDAVLNEANLTDAKVDGADFTGAVLGGANLANVDTSRAKNLRPPVVRTAGPRLTEFATAAEAAATFETGAEVDLGGDEFVRLMLRRGKHGTHAECRHFRGDDEVYLRVAAPTFAPGLLNLADRWPGATLRLDTIRAKGGRTRPTKLRELAVAAWSEVFGVEPSARDEQAQAAAARAEADALLARVRAEGVAAWDALDFRLRARIKDMRAADLAGVNLDTIHLDGKDLENARFAGSSLVAAYLNRSKFVRADFTAADLTMANLYNVDAAGACFARAVLRRAAFVQASLAGADLRRADLTDADLSQADLRGADLTGATLADTRLTGAEFDPDTKFPVGFTPPVDMLWHGPPRAVVAAHAPGTLSFADFFTGLAGKVKADRLRKVLAMLKKETFRLFAECSDEAVTGIVRSQSSADLAYACRLARDGSYHCGTQNQKPCGGLRGGLCKHLLVLIVGLTRSGDLDPATIDGWLDASRSKKAALDRDRLSETFLRYAAAQEGTIDWRPTETVPEDYYAL